MSGKESIVMSEHSPAPEQTISSAGRPLLQQSPAQQQLTSLSGKMEQIWLVQDIHVMK